MIVNKSQVEKARAETKKAHRAWMRAQIHYDKSVAHFRKMLEDYQQQQQQDKRTR